MNVYCCRLLLKRDTVLVMFSVLVHSTFTVQILYKLYSVQLNCTYSNYTEAAAAQQHTNCQLMSSEVECSSCLELYVYMDNHTKRLDTANSHYWLQAQCCSFHSDKEQVDVTKITDTLCKLMYCQCQVMICVNIYRKTLNFVVTN